MIKATQRGIAIATKALDAGIFYQDAFEDACKPQWHEAFPVNDACCITQSQAGGPQWIPDADTHQQRRELYAQLKSQLLTMPRGAWALLKFVWANDQASGTRWTAFIHDGHGLAYEPFTSARKAAPTFADVLDGLVGMEIYCARKAAEGQLEAKKSRETMASHGWRVGSRLKNIRLGGTNYSSAQVSAIAGDMLTLWLTKRGSSNRWKARVYAQNITCQADMAR